MFITENVHQSETVIKGHAEEEAREGKHDEIVREGGDNAGQGADQVAEDQGGDAPVSVGDVTQQQTTGDAAAEEQRLGQWRFTTLIAHPIQL